MSKRASIQEEASSLGHMPDGRWQFDAEVTRVFDDMLARSIPGIETMRKAVARASCRFVAPGTDIVDLGCSLGTAMAPLVERFAATNRFLGVDASEPMVETCRRRFRTWIEASVVDIRRHDLRDGSPEADASVTLCILTLMFTPVEHRSRILAGIFAQTRPGGALILVEKVLGTNAVMNEVLTDLYYAHKRDMGYTTEEIDRKRLALEGVLVPLEAAWNEAMLREAGFRPVECFWRCLNFCGWLAVKP
jgi:tRNA (cmo5U34)-methyltransferase